MYLRKRLLCGVATAGLVLGSMSAAMAAPDTPSSGWQGFYLGTHMGYGNARFKGRERITPPDPKHTFDANGFLYGAHAGYNWEAWSSVLFGIEGDITLMPTHGLEQNDHSSQWVAGHLNGIASLRGRLGYEIDNLLLYATGGLAFSASTAMGGHTVAYNKRNYIDVGGVFGGGLEYMVSPNMSVRAEGLYYIFNDKQPVNGQVSGYAGLKDTWMFRVGASWHLGDAPFSDPDMANASFNGFYIGAHTGYGSGNYSGVANNLRGTPKTNGFLTGIHAGYNWDLMMSNLVAGIEGDITVLPSSAADNVGNSTDTVSGHLSGIASLRARLGFQVDRALLYATGGIAFASTNSLGDETAQYNDRTKIATGGVLGGGIEFLTSENMAIRAEGLYYIFDQNKQGASFASGVAGLENAWMARVGASWFLNGPKNAADDMTASFAGFYFGGHAGYGNAKYSGVDTGGGNKTSFHAKGYLVGGHLGYNWEAVNNFLAGLEGDISIAPWNAGDDPRNSSDFITGHLNGVASLRGRLGFQVDRALLYATGGIAFAASNATGGATAFVANKTDIEVGPVAGLGIEFLADEHLSLRAEGLHYWFDQKSSGHNGGLNSGYAGIQNTWMFRVGASWYFN